MARRAVLGTPTSGSMRVLQRSESPRAIESELEEPSPVDDRAERPSGEAGFDRRFWIGAATLGAFTVVYLGWMIWSWGGGRLTDKVDDCGELLAAVIGGVLCLTAAARADGRARVAWRAIALGAFCWAAGQAVWSWYDVVRAEAVPFPGWPDVGFLIEVPIVLFGLLTFPVASSPSTLARVRVILDGVLISGSLLVVSWGTALSSIYREGGQPFAEVVSLAYPVGDVAILTVALGLLARASRRGRSALTILIVGTIALAVSDSAFVYLDQSMTYTSGSTIDVGWVVGFLLFGLAALAPSSPERRMAEGRRVLSIWQIVLPYVFLLGAAIYILVKYIVDRHLDPFLVIDGLALVAVVFVRQVLTLLEDARLSTLLSHQARHDPLTGLGNRVHFRDRVADAVARSRPDDHTVAVLLCDLDGFKDINDTLGHAVGDGILQTVAERLLASTGPYDSVARIGGDEFAVVLGRVTEPEQAAAVAIRIIDAMRIPFTTETIECAPWISVGIAFQHSASMNMEAFIRDADVALYAAKAAGGDTYRVYNAEMGEAHFAGLKLQNELDVALERGQFYLEYEPIVRLADGRPAGVEALLRWRHPVLGVVQPEGFIELAERSGNIVPIGMWALEKSLEQFGQWKRNGSVPDGVWLSVNISERQLSSPAIVSSIAGVLARTDVDARLLRLELTERAIVEQSAAQIDLLDALRSLGVRLVIDDFGTGYSSLSYLKWLPVDTMKIDRSFVADLGSDAYSTLIVDAMIRLAHAKAISVVAEGIETEQQLDEMAALGCDLGQGYFWSRSMGSAAFEAWLAETVDRINATGERPAP